MAKVSGHIVRNIIEFLKSKNLYDDSINYGINFKEAHLNDPDKRFDCSIISSIKQHAIKQSKNPHLFLELGSSYHSGAIGFLGYLISNSPTVRLGYQKICEYQTVMGDGVQHQLKLVSNSDSKMSLTLVDESLLEFPVPITECILSMTVAATKMLSGRDVFPKQAFFIYPKPNNLKVYEAIFNCELIFNATETGLVYSNEILDLPLKTANPAMYAYFDSELKKQFAEILDQDNLTAKVNKQLLILENEQDLYLENIAEKLNLSPRTLQRRLQEEGKSFNTIIQEFKKTKALNYIKQKKFSVSEISYILGFSEPSAFIRSFKKWTGQSPKEFRKMEFV